MAILTSYEGSNDDNENKGTGSATAAQGFTLDSAASITGIEFYGGKGLSNAGGAVTVKISEGSDPGVTTLVSEVFSTSGFTAAGGGNSPQWNALTFSSPLSVPAGPYFLIIQVTAGHASDEIRWSRDSTSPSYAGGTAWRLSGVWGTISSDQNFRINGDAAAASGRNRTLMGVGQ